MSICTNPRSSRAKKLFAMLQKSTLIVLLLLTFLISYQRIQFLVEYKEWAGIADQLAILSSQLEQDAVLFVFNAPDIVFSELLAPPLRSVYMFETISIRNSSINKPLEEQIARKIETVLTSNKSVYLIHPPPSLHLNKTYLLQETVHYFPYTHLTSSIYPIPTYALKTHRRVLQVYEVVGRLAKP